MNSFLGREHVLPICAATPLHPHPISTLSTTPNTQLIEMLCYNNFQFIKGNTELVMFIFKANLILTVVFCICPEHTLQHSHCSEGGGHGLSGSTALTCIPLILWNRAMVSLMVYTRTWPMCSLPDG